MKINDWPIKELGSILQFKSGKSIKPGGEGRFPVYGSNGIIGHSNEFRSETGIIIGRVGAYCGSIEYCEGEFWASDNTLTVTPLDEHADIKFLYYLLITSNLRAYAGGAAQPLVTQTVLKQVKVTLPPLPTQKKIAGILSAYDDLIENNLRRIKILEEMAQSLYREWFVHFRFPGHESTPMIDSPLGPIPEGWEVATVNELLKRFPAGKKYNQKSALKEGVVPILDQGKSGIIGHHNDQPGVEATEDDPLIVFANHTCYQRIIQYPFSAIQNVLPFRSSDDKPRNIYWLHWATKDLIEFNDYKGHWPEFIAKTLILPPDKICGSFGVHAEAVIRSIYKLERRNQNLRTTRDLLLPKLLTPPV